MRQRQPLAPGVDAVNSAGAGRRVALNGKPRWRLYATASGNQVVKKELEGLGTDAKAAVLGATRRVAKGQHLPYEDERVDADLRAVRVFLDGQTYRVLYGRVGPHAEILLAVHVFEKKSSKLPTSAKKLALKRLADWKSRGQ